MNPDNLANKLPQCSIVYTHDDDEHKAWVLALARRLRDDGVNALIDHWLMAPGDQLAHKMEQLIDHADHIVAICTPRYKAKANNRTGGAGYEGNLIAYHILSPDNVKRIIPVLRSGSENESIPALLAGRLFVDLRDGERYEAEYQKLKSTLQNLREQPPPIGHGPTTPPDSISSRDIEGVKASPATDPDFVKLGPIILDGITNPTNDQTLGSKLYLIPFQLSHTPSRAWADEFARVWRAPPSWTPMHQPDIARVSGDRIILDGTTMEYVKYHHAETLTIVVNRVNMTMAQRNHDIRLQKEAISREIERHRQTVADIARDLNLKPN